MTINNAGTLPQGAAEGAFGSSPITQTPSQVTEILNNTTRFDKRLQDLKVQYIHYKDGNIPPELHQEMKSKDFQNVINTYVQAHLAPYGKKGVLDSPTEEAFSILSFCLFLLGRGEFYNIYENLEVFHPSHCLSLAMDIQKKMYDIKDNADIDSHHDVQRFYNFFEVLNKIWILSEIVDNSHVKEGIQILSTTLLNKDILNFSDTHVAKKQDYFRGRLDLNFAGVTVDKKNGGWDENIKILATQIEGYSLCLSSEFGGDMSEEISTRQVLLGNTSTHALHMVKELKKLYPTQDKYEELVIESQYQAFIAILIEGKIISSQPTSLHHLEEMLSNNYVFVYDSTIHNGNLYSIVTDFVETQDVDNYKIETIYNVIHLTQILSLEQKMDLIRRIIQEKIAYKNSILEFFKLKTIASVLDDIASDINIENFATVDVYYEWIFFVNEYIDLNKRASHLMKKYGDLKKQMALILSRFYKYPISINQSELLLIDGITIQGEKIFESEYIQGSDSIIEQILINIGYAKGVESGFPLDHVAKDTLRQVGLRELEKTLELKVAEKKLHAGDALIKLFAETSVGEYHQEKDINQRACSVISGQLFFDIAQTFIVHTDEDVTTMNNKYFIKGQDTYEVALTSGYKLVFIYPSILKEVFMNIYNKNSDYIKQNLAGIISNYIKKKERLIDAQTGLPNDFKLREDLKHIPLGYNLLVVLVQNMDNFAVNFGFSFTTQYLKELGIFLQKNFAQKSGRYAGVYKMSNENCFGLILKPEEFETFKNRVKTLSVNIDKVSFPVDLKVGHISLTPENIASDVIHKAASALYYKEDRINRFVEYSEEKSDKAKDSTMMEYRKKLDHLEENARPFFQPIVDQSGVIQKFEVLMRVYNPNSGKLDAPFHYLQAAEFSRNNIQVDTIMMNKAFTYLERVSEVYPISLNLTPDFLADKEMIVTLIGCWNLIKNNRVETGKTPLENSYLTIEVLESDWGDNKEKIISQLSRLKAEGFKIALDDYGAASSNPHRLNELLQHTVVDYVKIDGSLIRAYLKELLNKPNGKIYTPNELQEISDLAEADIRALGEKSKISGFKIVAEFVEKIEHIGVLKKFGIELFQGYGPGKPRDSFEEKKEGE